jgi:hypothetical protein
VGDHGKGSGSGAFLLYQILKNRVCTLKLGKQASGMQAVKIPSENTVIKRMRKKGKKNYGI